MEDQDHPQARPPIARGFGAKASNTRSATIKARAWRERMISQGKPHELRDLLAWSGWRFATGLRVWKQLEAEEATKAEEEDPDTVF